MRPTTSHRRQLHRNLKTTLKNTAAVPFGCDVCNSWSPAGFVINPNDLVPHIAIIAEFRCVSTNSYYYGATNQNGLSRFEGANWVSLKGLAFHCERRGLLRSEGVSDPMVIEVVGK
jgi:hypothetical protein